MKLIKDKLYILLLFLPAGAGYMLDKFIGVHFLFQILFAGVGYFFWTRFWLKDVEANEHPLLVFLWLSALWWSYASFMFAILPFDKSVKIDNPRLVLVIVIWLVLLIDILRQAHKRLAIVRERNIQIAEESYAAVNKEIDSLWDDRNEQMVEAIMLALYKPAPAKEKIDDLLENGMNINARNTDGRTVMDIAKYHESPSVVTNTLLAAGAERSK